MELPSRPKNDRYTRPGHYNELERRLRANPEAATLPTVVAYAFDYRTRLGPFLFADTRLLTAGPRAQRRVQGGRGGPRRGVRDPPAPGPAHGRAGRRRAPAQDVPPPAPLRAARRHPRPGVPRGRRTGSPRPVGGEGRG